MRIQAETLKERIIKVLEDNGLRGAYARDTANCLVMADLYGIKTHGTIVLPSHIKRIKSGGYNCSPTYAKVHETSSFAVIDANNSIGFASASHCMRYAIEKSGSTGLFTVFSRNANAYGAASCYAMMAAEHNKIGFTCCNSPAAMAPIGGKERKFGTNPLSMVIPTGDNKPIIIDMATSKVAKSRFLQAKREGKPLGEGWALDVDGNPTTDPDKGIQGFVCPMEGFKGYGLALMIDIIAGLLSGAAWQDHVRKFYNENGDPMNVGHFFMAIDPIKILGEQYWDLIHSYVDSIRSCTSAVEGGRVALPGDDKHQAYRMNVENGIDISDEVVELLNLK